MRTKASVPKHREAQYVGNYGNFAYGNMTVVQDDVTSEILLEFDLYTCTARSLPGNNDTYYCEGYGDYWFLDLLHVKFDTDNNPSEYVDIVFVAPWEGRIRFDRDLRQDEAPGPRDHWPTCGQVFAGKGNEAKIKLQ